MRHETIYDEGKPLTEQDARERMPWAAVVKRIEGGWMGWEAVTDYIVWSEQR